MTPVCTGACTLLAGAWWRTWRPSIATPGPASPAASAGRTAGTPPSRSSSSCSRSTHHYVLSYLSPPYVLFIFYIDNRGPCIMDRYMIIRGWVNEHFISSKAIMIKNVNILGILSFMSSLLNCQKRTPIRCHKSSICYLVSCLPTQTEKIM